MLREIRSWVLDQAAYGAWAIGETLDRVHVLNWARGLPRGQGEVIKALATIRGWR